MLQQVILQQSLALYASALGVLIERARATSELSRTRALLTTAIDASPAGGWWVSVRSGTARNNAAAAATVITARPA